MSWSFLVGRVDIKGTLKEFLADLINRKTHFINQKSLLLEACNQTSVVGLTLPFWEASHTQHVNMGVVDA